MRSVLSSRVLPLSELTYFSPLPFIMRLRPGTRNSRVPMIWPQPISSVHLNGGQSVVHKATKTCTDSHRPFSDSNSLTELAKLTRPYPGVPTCTDGHKRGRRIAASASVNTILNRTGVRYLVLLRESLSSQNTPFAKLVRSVGDVPAMVGGSVKPQLGPSYDRPYRANRKLSTDELGELVDCYRRGSLASELAERFGIHRQTVVAHLKREGVTVRPQVKLTAPIVSEAVELYAEGWSTAAIGKKYGVDASTVGDALKRVGVRLRGPVADRWNKR